MTPLLLLAAYFLSASASTFEYSQPTDFEQDTYLTKQSEETHQTEVGSFTCYDIQYMMGWAPVHMFSAFPDKGSEEFKYEAGVCFKTLTFKISYDYPNSDLDQVIVSVEVHTSEPLGYLCSENILFGTTFTQTYHSIFFQGTKTFTFHLKTPEDMVDLKM